MTVEPGPGEAVQVTHTVNGRNQLNDPTSREELARLFLRVIRRTAFGAEQRVGRILAQVGVDGVFEELAHLDGSSSSDRYLTELLRQGDLDVAGLVRVAELARRRIPSSATRARFLIASLPYYLTKDAAQDAYFSAVTSISSSGSHARVLTSLLDERPDPRTLARLLRSARSISSGGNKSHVLVSAVSHYEADNDVRETFFEAADSISSSGDHARVLLALLDRGDLDLSSTVSLLRSAGRISSSGSRARVLMAAARGFMNDPAPRDAFLNAAASIPSSGDHARVLVTLLSTATLDDAALVEVLKSVPGIASSGSQARMLIAAAQRVRGNGELLAVYVEVARGISSTDERRRVLAAVGQSEYAA